MNEKTRNDDKLFSFDDLLKNLKNKEFKMTQNDKMINYVKKIKILKKQTKIQKMKMQMNQNQRSKT